MIPLYESEVSPGPVLVEEVKGLLVHTNRFNAYVTELQVTRVVGGDIVLQQEVHQVLCEERVDGLLH